MSDAESPCEPVQYLLLQVRNFDDPMREQEVWCCRGALSCDRSQMTPSIG